MSSFPDILERNGLKLRALAEQDLPEIAAQIGDARVATWLATVAQPFDAEAARALLEHSEQPGEELRLIEQDGAVAGGICMGHALWYWLAPAFWGQGLMQRALTFAIGARFARPAPPLIATCHEDNSASQGVLARLGFSPSPSGRRMFFQSTQRAEPCRDYLMAPEQWHLLHPPRFSAGAASLRPARQRDAGTLARMLPSAGAVAGPWPKAEALPAFIETHRFRGTKQGLFVVEDDDRRSVGMALVNGDDSQVRFLSDEDEDCHRASVETALREGPLRDP